MTKTQVEAMGGKIGIESTIDIGTTFTITFIDQQI
jgi:signal transduction histidine kinase